MHEPDKHDRSFRERAAELRATRPTDGMPMHIFWRWLTDVVDLSLDLLDAMEKEIDRSRGPQFPGPR